MRNNPVHWHDGLYLLPQHFQAADAHTQELIQLSTNCDHSYYYGLKHFELALDEITNRHFSVASCCLRTRDGTIIDLTAGQSMGRVALRPENDDEASGLNVDFSDSDPEGKLRVYVAIPLHRADGGNVSTAENYRSTESLVRYREIRTERQDESSGENYRNIALKVAQAKLIVAPPNVQITNYETLPIAQIDLQGDQGPELDIEYIPPLLSIDSWLPLHKDILMYLYNRIGNRVETLGEFVRGQGITWATADGTGQENLAWLSMLNEAQCSIHALVFSRGVHPFRAYSELCRIVGRLSIFRQSRRPPEDLPKYDHDDLGRIFHWFKAVLDGLLDVPGKQRVEIRQFLGSGSQMQVTLEPSWVEPGWQWYVGVLHNGITGVECHRILGTDMLRWKLASQRQVDVLYSGQNPGLDLRPLGNQTPSVLPYRSNLSYYDLSRRPRVVWDDVVSSKTLAIRFHPQLIENIRELDQHDAIVVHSGNKRIDLKFYLYAVPPESI